MTAYTDHYTQRRAELNGPEAAKRAEEWNAEHYDEVVTDLHTYSIVRDDRQTGWYDPGYGVRDDENGTLMNEEPFATEAKALMWALHHCGGDACK